MILPLAAAAAPMNFSPELIVALMSTNVKALFTGSKTPTPSALYGAKMIFPLEAAAAPMNLPFELIVALMSTMVKVLVDGSNTPTPSAL